MQNDGNNNSVTNRSGLKWLFYHLGLIVVCTGWGILRGAKLKDAFISGIPLVVIGSVPSIIVLGRKLIHWLSLIQISRNDRSESLKRTSRETTESHQRAQVLFESPDITRVNEKSDRPIRSGDAAKRKRDRQPDKVESRLEASADLLRQAVEQMSRKAILLLIVLVFLLSAGAALAAYWTVGYFLHRSAEAVQNPPEDADSHPTSDEAVKKRSDEIALERAIANKSSKLRPELWIYARLSEDIRQILSEELEEKKVGGLVAILATNWQCNRNRWLFKTPEEMGLGRIEDEQALVNRVRKGDVILINVILIGKPDEPLRVVIDAINTTEDEFDCVIPEGQLCEIKETDFAATGIRRQVFLIPQQKRYRMYPRGRIHMDIAALCFNSGLSRPNGDGSLTIFKFLEEFRYDSTDQSNRNQEELHRVVDKRLSCG